MKCHCFNLILCYLSLTEAYAIHDRLKNNKKLENLKIISVFYIFWL